jgi:hypothetical protein
VKAQRIEAGNANCPPLLIQRLGAAAPRTLYALGDPNILRHRLVGLICSIQCPGSIVIKTFDLIREMRDAGVVMIGGFHSPMEKDWSDYIDYWAVGWDFQNDIFMQGWVAFRTRKERKLPLVSDPHGYDKPGRYRILVKVIDIFGNDTSQALDVEVPLP